jgi:hypothetical protein
MHSKSYSKIIKNYSCIYPHYLKKNFHLLPSKISTQSSLSLPCWARRNRSFYPYIKYQIMMQNQRKIRINWKKYVKIIADLQLNYEQLKKK